VKIRPANSADAVLLAELERTQPRAAGWGKQGFEGELAQKCAYILCAQEAENLVGFVAARFAADMAEILNVAVHPKYVRCGIAKRLLQETEQYLKQHKIQTVTLEVAQDNTPAYQCYISLGFKPLHTRKDFYGPGKDAAVMGKNL